MEDIGGPYALDNAKWYKHTKDGIEQLTNFTAWIEKELIYHDGSKSFTILEIHGELDRPDKEEPEPLPPINVDATEFSGLNWIPKHWGMRPMVFPVASAERDIRAIIQMTSDPTKQHIYTHTGWTRIGHEDCYLHCGGAITRSGGNQKIAVQLPPELSRYLLPLPNHATAPFYASLKLINLAPKAITWPLLLATYRAAIGPSDFAIHLAGRTGTFKSECSSLFQSHFGTGMDARHLPASWSSTANALEAIAYRAKDALCVVDDFVPVGTAWQVRTLQSKADQFIRGQGNQAGRSRLNDQISMQQTFYPRGIILSTGEDIPEGHSVRGRMLILELAPGDIEPTALSGAQKSRPLYAESMAAWVHWLANHPEYRDLIEQRGKELRDQNLGLGHTRTPAIIGQLMATAEALFGEYAAEFKLIDEKTATDLKQKAFNALAEIAKRQNEYLTSADPVNALTETIRQLLGSQLAHCKSKSGGIPAEPTKFGWTEQQTAGEVSSYKSNGPRLAWVDHNDGLLYLDPSALTLLKRHSGGKLAITPQTLIKRAKEAGLISRTDASRERNTVRVTLEGHVRQVLALDLAQVMDDR